MIYEILKELTNCNIVVTASPGGGTTSFVEALVNKLAETNLILYFDPPGCLDREFIKKYYKTMYDNVLFLTHNKLEFLVDYFSSTTEKFDYVVVDPGDFLIQNEKVFRIFIWILNSKNTKIICTSQIRENPQQGGKVYSTVEEFNKKAYLGGETIFQKSIWIRNVEEPKDLEIRKYVDIYDICRQENIADKRFIVEYQREGNIICPKMLKNN